MTNSERSSFGFAFFNGVIGLLQIVGVVVGWLALASYFAAGVSLVACIFLLMMVLVPMSLREGRAVVFTKVLKIL